MSLKHRYSRTLPPGEGKRGTPESFARAPLPGRRGKGGEEECTCWVLMRGEGPQPPDRDTADCELVPDPACPVHGRKRFPILEDEDWGD
ncbi:MAG: hypothetical protein ABIF09_17355 [Gemmatimonadota bacterium]